jgi:tRNA-2-methylthio-N6-dimethylallyladenosine synthase
MNKKLYIKTYGCQMNVYDSDKISDVLSNIGYDISDNPEDSNIVILNTCNIREKASEKTYSELGRIKKIKDKKIKNKEEFIIAVAGCVSQAEGEEIFRRSPFVDIVVGPQSYQDLPELVKHILAGKKHQIQLEFAAEDKFDQLPESTKPQGVSSFLSIQEGCDKFCAFCCVPYTRGAEFSRSLEEIYREALILSKQGAREITLLGQNVNAYHGTSIDGNVNISKLITHLANIPKFERIRYTTSHPIDMDDELIALHASEKKLMPFLHLPVQSGSDKILHAMNRKHDANLYFDIIAKMRASNPDMAFSSDFIVGFPGETDQDFEDTMELVRKVQFASSYSFKYSPRPGTPAATKEQVPTEIQDERLQRLQTLLANQQAEFNQQALGKTIDVLFEKSGKHEGQISGKSPHMQQVTAIGDKSLIGKIVKVKIDTIYRNSLGGVILTN